MRPFRLGPSMKTLRGVFYPTGWTILMFPGEREARDAAQKLADAGVADGDVLLMTPQDFREHIVGATGDEAILPGPRATRCAASPTSPRRATTV